MLRAVARQGIEVAAQEVRDSVNVVADLPLGPRTGIKKIDPTPPPVLYISSRRQADRNTEVPTGSWAAPRNFSGVGRSS